MSCVAVQVKEVKKEFFGSTTDVDQKANRQKLFQETKARRAKKTGTKPRNKTRANSKKEMTLKDVIPLLEEQKTRARSARTSKLPEILSPLDDLNKAKELILILIDMWFGYKSHVLTTRMMYESGELNEELIKEYWPALKDIKIRNKKGEEPRSKMSVPKKRSLDSLLAEDRALDDRARGHT